MSTKLQTPSSSSYDRYQGYAPIEDALTEHFGTNFAIWNTGGGCMCIGAEWERDGWTVLVGSPLDGPLLPYPDHAAIERAGRPAGFNVGVYEPNEDGNEAIVYVSDPNAKTPADVTALVQRAINEAITEIASR